ncbi:MAG: WD40 repeat domain-containing protein, partial [Sphaerospermopsis kisseleviana]
NQILTTSFDKTIRLWDINGNLLTVFQDNSDQIQFSPDGSHILTYMYYARRNARLWNTKGNLVTDFQEKQDADIPQTRIYSAVFSPNGRQILIARENGSVRLWDTQGKLLADLRGHDYRVNSAVFSSNGSQILTAGADKTARLWDNKGNLLAIFRGHEQEVNSAVFSPNGNQILTASSDKTARLWDISTGIKVSAAEVAFITGNQLASQGTVESRKLALLQLEEAAKLYHVDKNYRQAASSLLSLGQIYANLGQFQSALDAYNRALNLSKQGNAKAEQAEILNNLGQLYKDLGDTKTAVGYYNQALPLLSQLNDQEALATTRSNLGNLHATTEQWENALQS